MTHAEKWAKVARLQENIRAVEERRAELCRELSRTIMTATPPPPARNNKLKPGRTFA